MKTAVLTDERLRLMNEVITGMRVIKMYGWELPFAKQVDLSRRREMRKIRQTFLLRGVNLAMFFAFSKVILLVAFAVFLLGVQGDLTPEKVFVCMSLFNNLRKSMTFFVPSAIAQGAETIISLKRIQKFLLLQEQSETNHLDVSNLRPELNQCGIWMNEVKASWSKDGEATLRNISLVVKPGELLAIVGPVGCGKSSLLMSILGELPISSGEVKVRGRLAYASQDPWMFADSVRENILFGRDFDEDKYRKVISVCALDKDMEQLPHGDQTAVGERGVMLSGGQKARVNLARAMYFDADIFLLDDPLSAVDASVSKHLFERCIKEYLKNKVRILVTHQIQFLKEASQILVLQDGRRLALGTYDKLLEAGVDLGSLVEDTEQERQLQTCTTNTSSTTSVVEEMMKASVPITTYKSSLCLNSCGVGKEKIIINGTSQKPPMPSEEAKSSGSVGLEIYKEYIRSGAGSFLQIIIVIFFIGTQILFSGSDFWLTSWTNLEQLKYNIKDCWTGVNKTFFNDTGFYNYPRTSFNLDLFRQTIANVSDRCFVITRNYTEDVNDAVEHVNMEFRLSVYAGFVLMLFVLSVLRTTTFFELCVRASISLHNKMFQSVLRSPMAFFDNNPIGRVLNRFSKDVGVIDETLTLAAVDAVIVSMNLELRLFRLRKRHLLD